MLANVKIEQDKENEHIHRVFVDGKQIEKITHIDFEINPCEIPSVTLNIERMSGVDFEGQAEVNFLKDPFTVQNACKILRDELLKHGDLYDGFVESILSMLKENSRYIGDGETEIVAEYGENQLAEEILKRIIGEEPNERKD